MLSFQPLSIAAQPRPLPAEQEKQDWGYYTRKGDNIYMVVLNLPFSHRLKVKVPRKLRINAACTLDGKKVEVTEAARDEYIVLADRFASEKEPFVICLSVEDGNADSNRYRDALT